MKINVKVITNLQISEVIARTEGAAHLGLRDVAVGITQDAKEGSPYLTGHNRRSIDYDVQKLVAIIYSASGYGGYLETGTSRMPARPYFKPAYDMNIDKLPGAIASHLS